MTWRIDQPAHRRLRPAQTIGANRVHDVHNATARPAVSIHVYSPPLVG